jgi:hypothetical protein
VGSIMSDPVAQAAAHASESTQAAQAPVALPPAKIVVQSQGPEKPWVGQAVPFDVQLWRPIISEGAAPPFSFAEVRMPGAIARFREEAPPPDEREEGAVRYLVQHRTLLVFPQTDGELAVPPLAARWNEGERVLTAQGEPTVLRAAFAPHASEDLVVSPEVRVEQTFDRPLEGLRVGDGFTRTVVLSAKDSDPIVLPTLEFAAIDGVSLHVAPPRDAANAERGQLSASRTFEATYVIERVGHYELAAIDVHWLEPRSGQFSVAQAPEATFWAFPNPGLGWSMWGSAGTAQLLGFGLSCAIVLVAFGLIWRRRTGGPFAVERALAERLAERRAFRGFVKSLGSASALTSLRSAYEWLRIRRPMSTERTLEPLRAAGIESARALAHLEAAAFSNASSPLSTDERRQLAMARRSLATEQRPGVVLNPK